MPKYTCAVADCTSYSHRKDDTVKGWSVFPRKKDPARRRLWETRCKRGPTWKATKHHAICSKHFINWCQGPSPSHPDPELFAYNQWGANKYSRVSAYKRKSKCTGDITEEPSSSCAADSSCPPLSTSNQDEPSSSGATSTSSPSSSHEVASSFSFPCGDYYYASLNQEVQDHVEVETMNQESSLFTGMYHKNVDICLQSSPSHRS